MQSMLFTTLAKGLLRDSTFADFEIKCGDGTYRVHRAIVACHSEYFKALFEGNYEESKKRAIDLKEDNPHAVKFMIDYFYGFDYEDAHDKMTAFSNILELHAAVYVVADKYNVPDLKKLAVKHFAQAAPSSAFRHENPKEAIKLAFTGTAETDRHLRDLVLDYWMTFSEILVREQGPGITSSIAQEVPDFAAEVLNKVAEAQPLSFILSCDKENLKNKRVADVTKLFQSNCTCGKAMSEHKTLWARREETGRFLPFWVKWLD